MRYISYRIQKAAQLFIHSNFVNTKEKKTLDALYALNMHANVCTYVCAIYNI